MLTVIFQQKQNINPMDSATEELKPSYAVIPGTGKVPSYAPTPSHQLPPDPNPLVSVDPNASLATQEIQRELQVSRNYVNYCVSQSVCIEHFVRGAASNIGGRAYLLMKADLLRHRCKATMALPCLS